MKKILTVVIILMCGVVFADSNDAVRFHEEYMARIKQAPSFFGRKIIPLSKMQTKIMQPRTYWNQIVKMRAGIKYMFLASADIENIDIDMILTDIKTHITLQRTYRVAADCSVVWFPRRTGRYLISVHYRTGRSPAFVAFRKYRLKD